MWCRVVKGVKLLNSQKAARKRFKRLNAGNKQMDITHLWEITHKTGHQRIQKWRDLKRMDENLIPLTIMGRDSSVGIVTHYGLDGPGIEYRWGGEIFRTRPDLPWGLPSLLYNGYRIFPGGKAAGVWRWTPTPPSSAKVKESVELYLYSPCGPSWYGLGWTLYH